MRAKGAPAVAAMVLVLIGTAQTVPSRAPSVRGTVRAPVAVLVQPGAVTPGPRGVTRLPSLSLALLNDTLARVSPDLASVVVSVTDLRTGASWEIGGDQRSSFMSSVKLPWAAMAVAAAGVGKTEPLAPGVFQRSSNEEAMAMIDLAGGLGTVNERWYPAFGMRGSCTQSWGDESYGGDCGRTDQGFANFATANDLARFLTQLWNQQLPGLGPLESARVLEWAASAPDAPTDDGDGALTGRMPESTWARSFHKVGWHPDYGVAADIGIIDLPTTTYAIAVSATAARDASDATDAWVAFDAVGVVACEVYKAMARDHGWDCGAVREPAPRPSYPAIHDAYDGWSGWSGWVGWVEDGSWAAPEWEG